MDWGTQVSELWPTCSNPTVPPPLPLRDHKKEPRYLGSQPTTQPNPDKGPHHPSSPHLSCLGDRMGFCYGARNPLDPGPGLAILLSTGLMQPLLGKSHATAQSLFGGGGNRPGGTLPPTPCVVLGHPTQGGNPGKRPSFCLESPVPPSLFQGPALAPSCLQPLAVMLGCPTQSQLHLSVGEGLGSPVLGCQVPSQMWLHFHAGRASTGLH